MKFPLVMVAMLSVMPVVEIPEAMAQKTKNCSPAAQAAIAESVQWMRDHRHQLKHDFKLAKLKGRRRRIRRRFDRKLNHMRFGCAEKVLCREKAPRVALHAFGIAGRKIRLCYDKMLRRNYRFCDLTEIVVHEFGHAIGVPKDRLGGHSRNQNDRVYRFGWFAGNLCRAERPGSTDYLLMP